MPEFVLVRHDNGVIAPVSAAIAKRKGFDIVEGDAVRPDGRLARPTRENGRAVKPRTTVAKKAAKKASGAKSSEQKAVTPTEGAAETTLTESKE